MNNEELLHELFARINKGEISREEIISRLNIAPSKQKEASAEDLKKSAPFSLVKMVYVFGAAIVAIGIIIFVSQIWDGIGPLGRISITLILGLLLAAIGSMLFKEKPNDSIGSVFHFIGGVLIPSGAIVLLLELSAGQDIKWPIVLAFGIIFVFYLFLSYAHKKTILTFFAILNGTVFAYSLVDLMSDGLMYGYGDLYAYFTMIMGLSYLLLAYDFRGGWNKYLVGLLSFFGIFGFLGAAFSRVFDSISWQLFFFLIVTGCIYLAVYMHSRSILIFSTIFLIAHISFITGKYFADSIGWPITLIALGFIFIGLGYAAVSINKKYI